MEIDRGGMRMDGVKYSEPVRRFALKEIRNRRALAQIPMDTQYRQCHEFGSDMERGVRFNSDNSVLERIESNYTEEEFMACPGIPIDAMLLDAARSDYWYAHEKDYGTDDESHNSSDEDDE